MSRKILAHLLFVLFAACLPLKAQTVPMLKIFEHKLTTSRLFLYEPSESAGLIWERINGAPVLSETDSIPDSSGVIFPASRSGDLYCFMLPAGNRKVLFLHPSKAITDESFGNKRVRSYFRNRFLAQRNRSSVAFLLEPAYYEADSVSGRIYKNLKPDFFQNADTVFRTKNLSTDDLYIDWSQVVYLQLSPPELIVLEQAIFEYLCQAFSYYVRAGLQDPLRRLSDPAIPEYMPDMKISLPAKILSSLEKRIDKNKRLIASVTSLRLLQDVVKHTRHKLQLLNQSERFGSVLPVKLALKTGRAQTITGLINALSDLDINHLQSKFRQILLDRKYVLIRLTAQKEQSAKE